MIKLVTVFKSKDGADATSNDSIQIPCFYVCLLGGFRKYTNTTWVMVSLNKHLPSANWVEFFDNSFMPRVTLTSKMSQLSHSGKSVEVI